ncbi:MAG: hypothetical protein LUQ66_00855 [Methanoregula sp.]|nr:hypothetical protein [Methanoregula sp.]
MNVKKMNVNSSKCLIAYFSRPDNNYVGGSIVNLPVGNTEVVATMIQRMTGATCGMRSRNWAWQLPDKIPSRFISRAPVAKKKSSLN